jgi:hypothetical protein
VYGALAKLPAWKRLMKDEDKIKAEEGVEKLRTSSQRGG